MLMGLIFLFLSRSTAFLHSRTLFRPMSSLWRINGVSTRHSARVAAGLSEAAPHILQRPVSYKSLPSDTLYVLDGTAMMYRCFYGMESRTRYRLVTTSPEHESVPCGALASFAAGLAKLIREIKPNYLVTAFDTGRTFRNEIFSEYKKHRGKVWTSCAVLC